MPPPLGPFTRAFGGRETVKRLQDRFEGLPSPHWSQYTAGKGRIVLTGTSVRFLLEGARAGELSDAQIDDYQGLPRRRFYWRPPLRMQVRARASHSAGRLQGTAGFGFWNAPFGVGTRWPALPQAIWFFYASPPSEMRLALGLPGWGWKAACLDAGRPAALLWAPFALPLVLLMRLQPVYQRLWPTIQQALAIHERLLEVDLTAWHTYELVWRPDGATWSVDGEQILTAPAAPRGPLAFVAWLDNQTAVVTPQGRLRLGLLEVPHRQWLELDWVEICSW